MTKKLLMGICSLFLAGGVMSVTVFSPRVRAQEPLQQLRDLYRQQSETEKRKQEAQRQLTQKQREAGAIEQRKKQVENNIIASTNKIADLEGQIAQLNKEIEQTAQDIEGKQQEIDRLTDNRNRTIRTLYKTGSPETWKILLTSNSIAEVIGRTSYFEALERQITDNLNQTEALKRQLEDQKNQLESKRREVDAVRAQQQRYRTSLEGDKKEKEQLLVANSKVQQDIKSKIAEAEKYANDLSVEIVRVTKELRERGYRRGGGIPKGTSPIGMILPMDYNYISRGFGPLSERDVFGMDFHTGMDLVAPCRTPIFAAADGTVTSAVYSIGYGNNVRIAHNESYLTLYAHLSEFVVQQGQDVKQNDLIGLEGTTGWSTGCHLHFEIRRNNFPEDPELYLGF